MRRVVRSFGARFEAVLDGAAVGFAEAQDDHSRGGSLSPLDGWADLAELPVAEEVRERGVGTWLVQHLATWLRLRGTTRFLVALGGGDVEREPWSARFRWRRIGRVRRGWERVHR